MCPAIHHHNDEIITAEEAARIMGIPVQGIGLLVQDGFLHFYRGITFLRSDVQRLLAIAPAAVEKINTKFPKVKPVPVPHYEMPEYER